MGRQAARPCRRGRRPRTSQRTTTERTAKQLQSPSPERINTEMLSREVCLGPGSCFHSSASAFGGGAVWELSPHPPVSWSTCRCPSALSRRLPAPRTSMPALGKEDAGAAGPRLLGSHTPLPAMGEDGDIFVHLLSTDCMPHSVLAESSSLILSYCARHQDRDKLGIAAAEENS